MLLDDSLRGRELVERFDGPLVDVGSGGGAPGIPLAHALAGPGGRAARGGAAQVRVPRGLGARERARRLGPRRGAGHRLGRRRRREGARASADGRRVVPAARAGGRRGRALGRAVGRARAGRGGRGADRRRARGRASPASSSSARPARRRTASRAGVGVAKKRPLAPERKLRRKPRFHADSPSGLVARLASDARQGLRVREPEGRRRQDDDRDQSRRLPRRGG